MISERARIFTITGNDVVAVTLAAGEPQGAAARRGRERRVAVDPLDPGPRLGRHV